jgi:hypothetical protein
LKFGIAYLALSVESLICVIRIGLCIMKINITNKQNTSMKYSLLVIGGERKELNFIECIDTILLWYNFLSQ